MKQTKSSKLSMLIFLFLITSLFTTQISLAQDCKTQAANKPSSLTNSSDNVSSNTGKMSAAEKSKMKPYLAVAEAWTKKIVNNFTGAKLDYHNNFCPDYLKDGTTHKILYDATGIKSYYYSQLMFFAYYCYDNSNTIHTEAESGSSIYVRFNNIFAFKFTKDEGVFSINGIPAFVVIQKKRSEGRVDYYEQIAQNNDDRKTFPVHEFIILRNSDKPIFIPVTRKEYLEQMLKDVDNSVSRNSKLYNEGNETTIKMFELEMKIYKEQDKSYTPEKEAKRRKWFEEDQEKFKKSISKISPEADAAKTVILQYLKKTQQWLNKNVKRFYDYNIYTAESVTSFFESLDVIRTNGVGEVDEETAEEVVTINPLYFNKTLTNDVPQVILVQLRNLTYAHMKKVAFLINQPGALAPLEAILNTGKSAFPVVTPTEIVSTYSLKYLPKLKSLSPLVVPAGAKLTELPVSANYKTAAPAALNFNLPPLSARLNGLPQITSEASYAAYVLKLNSAITNAVKPGEKTNADNYIKNKKINQSKQISNTAFAAWLQNAPTASLYLYSKAVLANPSDALAANNFSAFLIMGGLAEKAIPILEYWNKQKSGEATILANLGNAYYRLGDVNKAMKYLQQCVQKDSLHPTANKILCMMYLRKGDTKKAKDHATRSLTTSQDEQVITILRQIDNKLKPGEIMSRWPVKEFPMLKRIKLPAMPSKLDDMEGFKIDLEAEKKSLEITIDNIERKVGNISEDLQQKVLIASLTKGIPPLRVKAQYIIMDAMESYHREIIREADVYKYNLQLIEVPFSEKVKAIGKKYAPKFKALKSGEGGDEAEYDALLLAMCKQINAEKEKYLGDLSKVVNNYAQRREYISRKFYSVYANWTPYWMPETTISFPSIEKDYLKDMLNILSNYSMISKNNCEFSTETLPNKDGKLHIWEDEFCANFKGKIGAGVVSIKWDCNSWTVEGGEGLTGEFGVKYTDDGSFEDFTIGAGPGESWDITGGGVIGIEASTSLREFLKIGPNKATGNWEIKDIGLKGEATLDANVGPIKKEIKILEISAAVNAGINAEGVLAPILNLK